MQLIFEQGRLLTFAGVNDRCSCRGILPHNGSLRATAQPRDFCRSPGGTEANRHPSAALTEQRRNACTLAVRDQPPQGGSRVTASSALVLRRAGGRDSHSLHPSYAIRPDRSWPSERVEDDPIPA